MPDYHQYIGRVFNGSYRLDSLIRVGGMGGVYRASHTRLPRHFAIKVLPLDSQETPELVIRFQREAEITAALQHPHIVQVTDYNVAEMGVPYLVMEFLEGIDLRRHLAKNGKPPLTFLRTLIQQTTAALQAAHDIGVVHRDLKPSNLFLCPRPRGAFHTKVLDFGVSKIVGTQSEVTSTQASIGTPRYMAPEQARGRAADVDGRTDIFALCTMVYEMLTGYSPFAAESIPSMLYRIVHEDPEDLLHFRPDLPASLGLAVRRGLAKNREDRYASMRDVGLVLDAAIEEAIRLGCDRPEGHRVTVLSDPDDSKPSRTGPPSALLEQRAWATASRGAQKHGGRDEAKTRVHTGPTTPLPGATVGLSSSVAEVTGSYSSPLLDQQGTAETMLPRQDPLRNAGAELTETEAIDVVNDALTEISSESSGGLSGAFPSLPPGAPSLPPGAPSLPPGAPSLPPEAPADGLSLAEPLASTASATAVAPLGPSTHGPGSRKVIVVSALVTVGLAMTMLLAVLLLRDGDTSSKGKGIQGTGARLGSIDGRHDGERAFDLGRRVSSVGRDADAGGPDVAPGHDATRHRRLRHLVLTTHPSSVRVTLGGKLLGRTPLMGVTIPSSATVLRLSRSGYVSRTLSVASGESDVRLTMSLRKRVPRKGSLRVMTRRRGSMLWANISLDGQAKGQSPLVLHVTAGKHRLYANRSGYGSATRVVTVRPGGEQSVVLELK